MILSQAQSIANKIIKRLESFCIFERCLIGGSIRRKSANVGDIEIIALPDYSMTVESTIQVGMFPMTETIPAFFDEVKQLGKAETEIKVTSRQIKIMLPEKIKLDLFIPQEHDFFRQYAIRTGSGEFSHNVLARSWRKKFWVGTKDGLRKRRQCEEQNGTWICIAEEPTLPPVWNSEAEFFSFINVPHIAPELRYWNPDMERMIEQYQKKSA